MPSQVTFNFQIANAVVPGVRNRLNTTVIIISTKIPFNPLTIKENGTFEIMITAARNSVATT